MSHQVFVSHATEDLETARRVCKVLEADGISCWLATRDVKAGTDYAAAILDAIKNASLVLLVFSAHANTSPYVLREIERAIAYDRPVLSLRVDDAVPGSSMEYYLNLWQWLDVQKGVEKQRQEIVTAVRKQLDKAPGPAPNTDERPRAAERVGTVGPRRSSRRTWAIAIVGALVVVAAAGVGTWAAMRGTSTPGASSSTVGTVPTTGMASSTTLSTSAVASSSSSSLLPNIHSIWTELNPSGELPIGRGGHSMAYDPAGGRVIMFGGSYGASNGLDETWAYDPKDNSWTNLDPPGAVPSARFGSSMVYDPVTRRMIMFGGEEADLSGRFNDTWAYDPAANTWTELKPAGTLPPPRGHQATAYDPATHRMIIFGGNGDSSHFGDTWAYDPAANTWTELKPTGTLPPPRGQQWMVYNTSKDQVIMFGGWSGTDLNDTWAYDPIANTWTELQPEGGTLPHPRYSAPMVYCTSTGQVIMFGGGYSSGDASGLLNDTWAFDPDSHVWTLLAPQGTLPSARASSMVYDPATGQVIMFGGGNSSGELSDTWDYTP